MGDFSGGQGSLASEPCLGERGEALIIAKAASLVNGLSSTSSTCAEAVSTDHPLVDAHRRLTGDVVFLRSQVQNMMARRDLLIQQVKVSDGSS
ncbi:hypothetical protein HID58_074680 [Brassica napus]|uniref:Biogenesis of lysosome-related organelles complex 1 subunit 7 n=1 Tax=Brassica napus TaxID=3708 RepID=A0ABQ7YK65_BRANA|nr:hypothetical protein HID58_074680 [Brassica napus]